MRLSVLWLAFICLLTNVSCAETPSPLVSVNKASNEDLEDKNKKSVSFKLNALVFSGFDVEGTACQLALAIDNNSQIWSQIDYRVHKAALNDGPMDFYLYKLSENTFYNIDDQVAGAKPSLFSFQANAGSENLDVNKLKDYEKSGILKQSIRIDFFDLNRDEFIFELSETLKTKKIPSNANSSLYKINRLILKLFHIDHFDGAQCDNFSPLQVEERTFSASSSQEDESHKVEDDHDHKDDDVHDHEDSETEDQHEEDHEHHDHD